MELKEISAEIFYEAEKGNRNVYLRHLPRYGTVDIFSKETSSLSEEEAVAVFVGEGTILERCTFYNGKKAIWMGIDTYAKNILLVIPKNHRGPPYHESLKSIMGMSEIAIVGLDKPMKALIGEELLYHALLDRDLILQNRYASFACQSVAQRTAIELLRLGERFGKKAPIQNASIDSGEMQAILLKGITHKDIGDIITAQRETVTIALNVMMSLGAIKSIGRFSISYFPEKLSSLVSELA